MCMGPERRSPPNMRCRRRLALLVHGHHEGHKSRLVARLVWALGKFVDIWRTFSWGRSTIWSWSLAPEYLKTRCPCEQTGVPYAMFLLCVSGRIRPAPRLHFSPSEPPRSRLGRPDGCETVLRTLPTTAPTETDSPGRSCRNPAPSPGTIPCTPTSSFRSRHLDRRSVIHDSSE